MTFRTRRVFRMVSASICDAFVAVASTSCNFLVHSNLILIYKNIVIKKITSSTVNQAIKKRRNNLSETQVSICAAFVGSYFQ